MTSEYQKKLKQNKIVEFKGYFDIDDPDFLWGYIDGENCPKDMDFITSLKMEHNGFYGSAYESIKGKPLHIFMCIKHKGEPNGSTTI